MIELVGAPASPYTRKMLALMRYRHIPYRVHWQRVRSGGSTQSALPQPKVPLLPTFYFPNEAGALEAMTDSTPIIRKLEQDYEPRATIPSDESYAFLNWLIEDYADEWLTKAMFHYRWHYKDDIEKASAILPRFGGISTSDEDVAPISAFVRERQIERLSYVGSNATTKPIIEEGFETFLGLLNAHLTTSPYLFGQRPSSADFAIYGQLTCLALFDPTPQAMIVARYPRIYAWVEVMEDLSGLDVEEADWPKDAPSPTLTALLSEIGKIYMPYLVANAAAVASGAEKMSTTIDGQAWEQAPFTYQAKCLAWTRDYYKNLSTDSKVKLDQWLKETQILDVLS